jgi:DNA-binding NtrC family response regulator
MLQELAPSLSIHQPAIDADAIEAMKGYHWPGNVRELRNAVQRAYVMAEGEQIDEHWLPVSSAAAPGAAHPGSAGGGAAVPADNDGPRITLRIGTSMAEAEKALILATFRHYGQYKERTAAVLGISLKTLYNRLKEYQAEINSDSTA